MLVGESGGEDVYRATHNNNEGNFAEEALG
jgi:hypothetical protein